MIRIPGTIPITIYPFFWLLAIGIGWINTFNVLGASVWVVVIIASVLVHEFGHALTAIYFGQTARINLVAMGGVTERRGARPKLWQDFIIVLCGPLAGLMLGLLAFAIKFYLLPQGSSSLITYALTVTFYVNVFWTVLNLVPVQPLDGGKLLGIVLESILGVRGVKISLFISMIVSLMLGLLFFSLHAVLVGVIFMMLAFEGYRSWQSSLAVTEQDQNSTLQDLLKGAERDYHRGNQEDALSKFMHAREMAQSGVIYQSATEQAAALLSERGDTKEAYELLAPIANKLSPESLRLLHKLSYLQGKWQEAVSIGTLSYQTYPDYETALTNALCLSHLGEAQPAIGWLQCSIKNGLPNLQTILHQREFDNIRQDPLFQKLTHT